MPRKLWFVITIFSFSTKFLLHDGNVTVEYGPSFAIQEIE